METACASVHYTFFGKVHPERCNVSIPELRAIVGELGAEISGELRYWISLSQVTATFVCANQGPNVYTLKNYVEDVIRVALDALGYTLGCGYDLEVTQMIDSMGNPPVVFGVGVPIIERAAGEEAVTFDLIVRLFNDTRGGYLQHCLADLREAIRVPKDTGFFCYRAIESLKQFFLIEGRAKDEKEAWEMLRSELEVERSALDTIKVLADPARHGNSQSVSDAQRAAAFTTTWDVVNKFLKYGNAGYKKA
jgi:hypothetical protein